MKIGLGVSELWRVENRPLPLTWPMAYTTACTTVQAVIVYFLYIFMICAWVGLTYLCTDYPPACRGSAIPLNIGVSPNRDERVGNPYKN